MPRSLLAVVVAAAALALPSGAAASTAVFDVNSIAGAAFTDLSQFDAANSSITEQPRESNAPDAPAAPSIAVLDAPLNGFPAAGKSIFMSAGGATAVDITPGSAFDPGAWIDPVPVTDLNDRTTIKLGFRVPAGGSCLTFDFRILSDESVTTTTYNEGLIAQIDNFGFTLNPDKTIVAPGNFALAPGGGTATVFNLGPYWSSLPGGTSSYPRTTSTFTASADVTPGLHTLNLGVFDIGDDEAPTGAQIAGIRVGTKTNGVCGAFVPSNVLALGRPKVSSKKGTAALTATVESPGAITVYDAKGPAVTIAAKKKKKAKKIALIKKSTVNVAAAGAVPLAIKSSKAGMKILKAKGKLRVRVAIAYKPTGGVLNTQYKTVTLKLKRKKKR